MGGEAAGVGTRPVTVTGAAGFVGSHVVRALLASGRRVIATDAAAALATAPLAGLDTNALTYVAGDLRAESTLDALLAAAGTTGDVVHIAARIQLNQLGASLGSVPPTASSALASLDINAMASWRLCVRFVDAGLLRRFVHVSTRSVFGGRPSTPDPIGETEPQQPSGVYGGSKAAAELGLLALREQFSLDLAIARITGVFGPWQGPASFIGQAMDSVLAGRPHRQPTGGDDAYELTYVKDAARGIVAVLDADRLEHAVYHVASGDRLVRLAEVADAFGRADPATDVHFGSGAHAASLGRTPLDVSRMRDELGFSTTWNLDDAIEDYLQVERTGDYGHEALVAGDREGTPR